jgi:ABC-2 type transport system ATP-binding protein
MRVLAVHELCKSFDDRTIVDSLSFELNEGEIVGLIGPSGAGKTTVLAMIAGQIEPDAGSIWLRDRRLAPLEKRAEIALCGQSAKTWQGLTCAEQLLVCANILGLGRKAAAARAKDVLRLLALIDCHDRRVESMTPIELCRLQIAAALLAEPAVLLLDEPCAFDEERSYELFCECIREISTTTVVLLASEQSDPQILHRAIRVEDGFSEPLTRLDPPDSTVIECATER